MSDLEIKPIHKFFRLTISSIRYAKNTDRDTIALYVNNNSPYKTALPLGLLGYRETNAAVYPKQVRSYRVNKTLKLLDFCQSTILNKKLSINNITTESKKHNF